MFRGSVDRTNQRMMLHLSIFCFELAVFLYSCCISNSLQSADAGGDYNMHSANTASEEENMPLVTRDVSHRHCCQPDMNDRWLKPSLVVKYPAGATRMRLGMTIAIAVVLCFTACIVLFHPHGVGVLASPVKRYLSSDSAS